MINRRKERWCPVGVVAHWQSAGGFTSRQQHLSFHHLLFRWTLDSRVSFIGRSLSFSRPRGVCLLKPPALMLLKSLCKSTTHSVFNTCLIMFLLVLIWRVCTTTHMSNMHTRCLVVQEAWGSGLRRDVH